MILLQILAVIGFLALCAALGYGLWQIRNAPWPEDD